MQFKILSKRDFTGSHIDRKAGMNGHPVLAGIQIETDQARTHGNFNGRSRNCSRDIKYHSISSAIVALDDIAVRQHEHTAAAANETNRRCNDSR